MLVRQATAYLFGVVTIVRALPPPTGPLYGYDTLRLPPTASTASVNLVNGTNPLDAEVCTDSTTCGARGRRIWEHLLATISQPNPVDRTDGQAKFDMYYESEFGGLWDMIGQLYGDLKTHGFRDTNFYGWSTFSTDPTTGAESEETAYKNLLNLYDGVIIAVENYRDFDEQKQLPWSELMYVDWGQASEFADERRQIFPDRDGGGPISNLRSVVQARVQNDQTQAVILEIWRLQGLEYNTGDTNWYKYTFEDPLEPLAEEWFYSLVGTDNVKGTAWLLNDHAAEIGKKVITEIYVRWTWVDPDIWINVGPYTAPSPEWVPADVSTA
ncbi:MAG: hypothetical protein Q9183_005346 [Haloplaca sp. 2 TL-2023]